MILFTVLPLLIQLVSKYFLDDLQVAALARNMECVVSIFVDVAQIYATFYEHFYHSDLGLFRCQK